MIRVLIALVHTALGVGATTGGLLVLGQAVANGAWEVGFYGVRSDDTWTMLAAAVLTIVFGASEIGGAVAWFAGASWGAPVLLGVTAVLVVGAPWSLGLLLLVLAALITLDAMVQAHRASPGPPPG